MVVKAGSRIQVLDACTVSGMQVNVLRLRQAGVVSVIQKSRDCKEHDTLKLLGLLEMVRGRQLALRSITSYPGSKPLIELFAPTLIAWDQSCIHVRGFEQASVGERQAGVLQEWIIWPL